MYQIYEGFSDNEVYEFNAKRYRTILKYCIILKKNKYKYIEAKRDEFIK